MTSDKYGFGTKLRKWLYLGHGATNIKNKTTFFSSILKVEEKKVVLLFQYTPQESRYGRFLVLGLPLLPKIFFTVVFTYI